MPQFLPSELPVRATTRQHWIVLFRRVHKWTFLVLLLLVLLSIWRPFPTLVPLVLIVGTIMGWRYLLWRNERVYLTSKRVVRMEGIPALTRHEAWLRVDRISGARFEEEGLARALKYANIYLEAPGDHPGVRNLIQVSRASTFYLAMRDTVFGEAWSPDPDDRPTDYLTEPLPQIDLDKRTPARRDRRGR